MRLEQACAPLEHVLEMFFAEPVLLCFLRFEYSRSNDLIARISQATLIKGDQKRGEG
jgi:hypothetical protein